MTGNPFSELAKYQSKVKPEPKPYREGVLRAALTKVQKLKVGEEVRIVSNKATVDTLRKKTGFALISFGFDQRKGTCMVRRLPDGTEVKRGMKASQFR